ncbi:MAG: adenylate/guanylate cyclase domain-containing protein, partial [Bacteroidota bacterium]
MKHLIPYRIQAHYLAQETKGSLVAYTLFVDLKGFTPLTEGLMREGHQGAERLSTLLNEIFEPLVRLVYARGGFIPYFAGDAFTAIFPAEDERQTAEGLVQTAAMARALFERRKNRFGNFTIGLKFGLSYGQVDWGIVGNQDKTFYYSGTPIENCAFCQTLAEVSDIVIDGLLLRQLPNDQLTLEPVGEDAYRVSSNIPISNFPVPLPGEDILPEVAAAFLPEAIVNYKQEGEFRPVVSIFIGFENVNDHDQLNLFADIILQQTISFSGYFKEIDFGDKGGVVTLFFGAPVAFENNIKRALEFIVSLREAMSPAEKKYDWKLRAGVTIGTAYTGIVGGEERCQYACVGNRVNLAARLMTKADWGEVLVDEDIQDERAFRFLHTGNIKYKGIKGNVPTYKLLGRNFNAEPTYSGTIIARDSELAQVNAFSQPLLLGKSAGVAYVFGEAGVGKSRFTYEWRQQLTTNAAAQWFVCQADQILHKPFNPFLYFLLNYFDQSPEEAEITNRANFQAQFQRLLVALAAKDSPQASLIIRELERTRPILAALLDLHDEDSLWEQLDAKGRYQNTIGAIINLFLAESLLRPLVVEMEDAQWLDDSSTELLQELQRAAVTYPVLLLIVARYSDDGSKTYPLSTKHLAKAKVPVLEVALENLPKPAVRQFAERQLGGPITSSFLALLLRTTNSNPFYLEQMLEYFVESGLISQTEQGELLIEDEHVK